jgi:hypothetical protein
MKLIVKLPKEKPPFIGVLLSETDNRAYPERLNEDLINEHKYAGYRLVLEFSNQRLNLSLISDGSGIVRYYKEVDYEGDRLTSWVYMTRHTGHFNFGHVRLEQGKEKIVKTWGKKINFVLPLQKYEIGTAP